MKPYLVDVPVRVNIWIRPECQRKQFEVLKQARPSIIFLQSDGGRNEKEWEAIRKNREIFENEIDWECEVHKIYETKNQGLYTMGRKVASYIWERVDRCIFLEDDYVPSVSYFRFCAELLEKYKDDERIQCICGMNHLGVSEDVNSDYFFSRQGSIWGTATWKRTYLERGNFEYGNDPYVMKLLKQRTRYNNKFWKRICAYTKQTHYEGHVAGGEFWIEFSMYAQNRLQIVPKYNMISNIGCSESAAHATTLTKMPKGIQQLFNMKTYEIEFPLKHAKYVIPDVEYEIRRNRTLGYNMPWIIFSRKIEIFFKSILCGDFKRIKKKAIKLLRKKDRIEN